jgi:DNA modification methylase
LVEPCILAGCPKGVVLDPFGGTGTTAVVADRLQRDAILIELNPAYADMAVWRLREEIGMFALEAAE